jgi:hypothetical protein
VGEAGPVEPSSAEAKSLKLRAKGLPSCHPSGQQPRQPDGGARRPNKELLSRQFTKRKTPYLLTLALSKFLLEFIIQPIRSGSRSEKLNYPKLKDI